MHTVIRLFLIISCVMTQHALAGHMENLRNQRYCEIIVQNGPLSLAVYNTIGLNACPQNVWQKLTAEAIKKQKDVRFVYLNGPRRWVVDGVKNAHVVDAKIENFQGLSLREAGIVKLSIWDVFTHNRRFYTRRTVERSNTWVYEAHQPVYVLIDPDARVYVMQSFSLEKRPQTLASLSQLAMQLKNLPAGWHFCTGVLPKTGYLPVVDNKAEVVQDEFLNTYQLQVDPEFIHSVKCVT